MKKNLFIEALTVLDQEDLLGLVGKIILENQDKYPITIENSQTWTEEQGETAITQIAQSYLCSNDDIQAIEDWVAPEEKEKIENKF